MRTSSFLGLKCSESTEEIMEGIKRLQGGQISIDLARFQTHFAPKPATTLLLDLDQAYTLRQSLNLLAQQSVNAATRIDNDRDKELYVLATLAEIEVQMTLGQKIAEIVDETLHGKKPGHHASAKKIGLDSYVQQKTSKSQQRKQSKGSANSGS
jgi:hypothetical protein